MTLLQILGLAVLSSMLLLLLSEKAAGFRPLLLAASGVLLLMWFVFRISPAFQLLGGYLQEYTMDESGGLLLKALAVGYLTELGGDTCRDLGAEGIAKKLELCGRAELLLLSLPALSELLTVALSLTI